MSGVKRVDLEEEARARARALEQAAREREERLRQQAQQQLSGACERGQRLMQRLAQSGAVELGRFLAAEQAQAQMLLADVAPVTALQQRLSSLLHEHEQAERLLTFVEQVPAGETRRALLRSLGATASSAEQMSKLSDWSRHAGSLAQLETALAELAETLQFLRACVAARVPLSEPTQRSLQELESYLQLPDADSLRARAAASRSLRTQSLREQLAERERQLLISLSQLGAPRWHEKMADWRPELGTQLGALAEHVKLGEWTRAAPLLREMEDFLLACTRHRVEVICQGAQAAGLQPSTIEFDPNLYAFYAKLLDEQGHFANVVEYAPDWRTGLQSGSLLIEGPSTFDGPACMREGIESLIDGVQSCGSRIHRVEGSNGEVLYEERSTDLGEEPADSVVSPAQERAPALAQKPTGTAPSPAERSSRRALEQ